MVAFRFTEQTNLDLPGMNTRCNALIILTTPTENAGLDMRLVGHLAEIVQAEHFLSRWLNAKTDKELHKILISDEHFAHLTVKENSYFADKIGSKIGDINLPGNCLIAIIYRNGDLIIPHGDTELERGDELSIIGNPANIKSLMNQYLE